jgi:predicted dehydrogenase
MGDERGLVLVGGGRWARVYLSVLARVPLPKRRIIVVSQHGGPGLAAAINAAGGLSVSIAGSLDDALAGERPRAAIIANAARLHARTALAFLERGIPVLLEKPVALSNEDADKLVAAAETAGAALVPSMALSHCSYLHVFRRAVRGALGPVRSVEIRWLDAASEIRYGERKGFDAGLGVAEDVGAHLWTLLSLLLGRDRHEIRDVAVERGGRGARLSGESRGVSFTLAIGRVAPMRERSIVVRDDLGREARLDFAVEPGTMHISGVERATDPRWHQRPTPMMRQLARFLLAAGRGPQKRALIAVSATTQFLAQAAEQVRSKQRDLLNEPGASEEARLVALMELLAPKLAREGLCVPGDNAALEHWARQALRWLSGAREPSLPAGLTEALSGAGLLLPLNVSAGA